MEHDLCESEPQDKPENPTSEPTKSIETNKTPVQVKKKHIDYSQYCAHFLGVPIEKIKATFQATTQFATKVMAGNKTLQTIKSPWPANNVRRRNEPVATDTVKAQVPAIDDGSTMAQLFIRRKPLVSDAYGVKTDAAFVNTLEDNICQRGSMDTGDICLFGKRYALFCSGEVPSRQLLLRNSSLPTSSLRGVKAGRFHSCFVMSHRRQPTPNNNPC